MPSPFPGMNPYLEHEDAWHNFHEQFPTAAVEMLVPQVGPNYFVKVDKHVYIHELPDSQRRFLGRADVSLARPTSPEPETESPTGTLVAPQQFILPAVDRVGLSYVEIRDRRSRRLVTVIELLSPSNKQPGPDRDQYEAKRAEILTSRTHLVELDLLRGGARMPGVGEVEGDYCAMVSRAPDRPRADLWAIKLRERLPVVPVPLVSADPDAQLDLQAILNRLYDAGGYAQFSYEAFPDPPLAPQDAAWALSLVPPGSA